MALSRFPGVMQSAVDAVLNITEKIRFVKNSSGDLLWQSLDDIQDGLRRAKETTFATFIEAEKQPEWSEEYMAKVGGPVSIAEYKQLAVQVETAAYFWNLYLTNVFLPSLPQENLIGMVTNNYNGVSTRHIERPFFIPGSLASPLRQSKELADLLSAFESVGG